MTISSSAAQARRPPAVRTPAAATAPSATGMFGRTVAPNRRDTHGTANRAAATGTAAPSRTRSQGRKAR